MNRFDDILERFNTLYGLHDGPQTQPFSRRLLARGDIPQEQLGIAVETEGAVLDGLGFSDDGDRELVEEIINFTRMVMENCGNRSLYASSSRLNDLLNTTSLSLLETTLRLALRLAQRYSASRLRLNGPHLQAIHPGLLLQHYMFDLEKLEKLAQPFVKPAHLDHSSETPNAKTNSDAALLKSDLLTMVRRDGGSQEQWNDYGAVTFNLTENLPNSVGQPQLAGTPNPNAAYLASPTPIRRTSGLSTVSTPKQRQTFPQEEQELSLSKPDVGVLDIPYHRIRTTPLTVLVKECIDAVPRQLRYSVLQKLRIAYAVPESLDCRRTILTIRLLAIANLSHIYPEQSLQQKVLQQDTEAPRRFQLPHQLCDLIHPPGNGAAGIPKSLQSVALETLEGLTNHKGKGADVCSELGFSASHGVLSYVVRKAVSESAVDETEADEFQDREWRDSLFSLVSTIPRSNQRSGEALLSSGLIELLVEALNYRTQKAEIDHPRILNFLDTYVYTTGNGFNALVEAKGLDSLSELLAYEVDVSISCVHDGRGMPQGYKTSVTDYQIPFFQQQTLRALVKFLNHVMGFTGTPFDRVLRNLIESSQLLKGLRVIISNPRFYGSNVWSGAVNVFSNFIHSEPTSYAAIAEAGLTKAFLETITHHPLKSHLKIANALGPAEEQGNAPVQAEAHTNAMDVVDANPTSDGLSENQNLLSQSPNPPGQFLLGVLPTAESIAAIAQAFSAVCLNETGMQQLETSQALRFFFMAFISPSHVKSLSSASGTEVESLGRDLDELARHHPRLKPEIVKLASYTANQIAKLAYSTSCIRRFGPKLHYTSEDGSLTFNEGPQPSNGAHKAQGLQPADMSVSDLDDEMSDARSSATNVSGRGTVPSTDEGMLRPLPTGVMASAAEHITIYAKFLSGFFNNGLMCTAFIDVDGVENIVNLAFAPSLPWSFHNHGAPPRIVRTLHTLVEHKPHLVLPSIITRMQAALEQLKSFIEQPQGSSIFESFVEASSPQVDDQRRMNGAAAANVLRALIAVQTSCAILTKSFAAHNGRSSSHNPFSNLNLTDIYAELVTILGKLESKCLWESTLLNAKKSEGVSTAVAEADGESTIPPAQSRNKNADTTPTNSATASTESTNTASSAQATQVVPVEDLNSSPLFFLLDSLPLYVTKFLHALGKAVLPRRMPTDSYQRQNVLIIGQRIAEAFIEMLNKCDHPSNGSASSDSNRHGVVCKIKDVLIDGKADLNNGSRQILSVVVQPFKAKGGIRKLGEMAQAVFHETTTESFKQDVQDVHGDKKTRPDLIHTLHNIFTIFTLLTNHQAILEASPQTTALVARLDQRDRGEYFSPNQFLLEIRKQVLDGVLPLWNSPEINTCTEETISSLATILQYILEEKGEEGAFKRADAVPNRAKPVKRVWRIRAAHDYDRLIEKGFSSDLVQEALYRCNDNYVPAQEYCTAYKKNPSLQRHPPPADDIVAPVTTGTDPATSPANVTSETQEPFGDSPATSPRSGNQVLASIPASMLQTPLGAQAEAILREAGAATFPTEGFPHSSSLYPSRNDTTREKAGDRDDIITIEDLDEQRVEVRNDLMDRCLTILDVFQGLTFELAELIIGSTLKAPDPLELRQEITTTLVQSLISYQGTEDLNQNAKKIAAVAHLLGIVLQEKDFFVAAQEELKDSFSGLLAFLSIPQDQRPEDAAPWIAQILLILEHILAKDSQPQQIRWEPPNVDQPSVPQTMAQTPVPVVPYEDKSALFNHLLDVLPRVGKNVALGNAVVRILVILTRTRQLAVRLGHKKNMQRLFVMVKQLSGHTDPKFRSGLLLVLRHIIEDEDTIRQIIRSEIQIAFEKGQRPIDTTTYTRNHYHLALRAPEIFVELTNELLELQKFDRSQNPQILSLKKVAPPSHEIEGQGLVRDDGNSHNESDISREPVKAGSESHISQEKGKSTEMKTPIVETPDGVIHYLLSELLSYREVEDKESQVQPPSQVEAGLRAETRDSDDTEMMSDEPNSSSRSMPVTSGQSTGEKKVEEKPQFKPEEHPIYVYRCFILQCLSELLQSYNRTKVEFINYSRKVDTQNVTPSKPRSGALNYLLNSLMPIGTVQHPEDLITKKKSSTSGWAINVIVALCARTPEKGQVKRRDGSDVEDEPDLLFVRRFVLEHTLKSYKETLASSEPFEFNYSKLISMADLFNKMLAGRAPTPATGYTRAPDGSEDSLIPTQKQIAKIMFEKNFIAALTNSISEVDSKIPGAGRVVKYILRPLKLLTHTAIELSLASDISGALGHMDEDEISSATSTSDVENDREETPDFYRNSTLGMFEPGREDDPTSGSSDEEDDEDMYGEEYADDMEYEEEDAGHDDDVVSDEDMEMEGMEGMGPIEGLPGDMGMSVEIDIDDEEESDEDDDEGMGSDDEDDDELDDDEDGDDIEIMDEITGDDENGSLADGDDEGDWQDEGEDEMGFIGKSCHNKFV